MSIEKISDVPVGAILARQVEDSMGRVLINSGEPLTEQLINVLKKRGFTEVEIRPPALQTQSPGLAARTTRVLGITPEDIERNAELTELRVQVAERFDGSAAGHAMKDLRQAVEHVMLTRHVARTRRA